MESILTALTRNEGIFIAITAILLLASAEIGLRAGRRRPGAIQN